MVRRFARDWVARAYRSSDRYRREKPTDEWTPLEPNVAEHKYYAAGVGDIKEIATKGPQETLTLVDVKHG